MQGQNRQPHDTPHHVAGHTSSSEPKDPLLLLVVIAGDDRDSPSSRSYRRVLRDYNDSGLDHLSEHDTINSDNILTIPLKLVISVQLTKLPLILLDNQNDQHLYNALTTETLLAPLLIMVQLPQNTAHTAPTPTDLRDTESVVTLASSTRRIRRRSIDTNCLTAGIPPASIFERIIVHPGGGYDRSIEDQKSERSGPLNTANEPVTGEATNSETVTRDTSVGAGE